MAFNYKSKTALATNKLTFYGTDITVSSTPNGAILGRYKGIRSGVRTENVSQTVIETSQATLYIDVGNGYEPKVNEFARMGSDVYNIVYVDKVNLAGETNMYTLFVSKGG